MNFLSLLTPAVAATVAVAFAVGAEEGNAYVSEVKDGDTFVLGDGSTVRMIGIDTPELDEPCGLEAMEALRGMIEHRTVTLTDPVSVQDTDRYGRLLSYVDTEADPAVSLLREGLAVARYDSTDGYDPHPRELQYHALEVAAVAACPTLDRESPWFTDAAGYRDHLDKRARQLAERRRAAREERRIATAERRAERRLAEVERRLAAREARLERLQEEEGLLERETEEQVEDEVGATVDPGYTGPRCYAPGGKTWKPC